MPITTHSSPLLDYMRQLVKDRPKGMKLKDIARDIGVTPKWLGDFVSCKPGFDNPSARNIEALYKRLTGRDMVDHV